MPKPNLLPKEEPSGQGEKRTMYAQVQNDGNVRFIELAMTYDEEPTPVKRPRLVQAQSGSKFANNGMTKVNSQRTESILESRLAEIVRQSENEGTVGQHYIEIMNEPPGSLVSADGTQTANVVQGNQLVQLDLMNFRLIRYEEDGAAREVTAEEAANLEGSQQQYLELPSNDISEESHVMENLEEAELILPDVHPKHRQTAGHAAVQYVQVVERDSVPMVFYAASPPATPAPHQQQHPTAGKQPGRRKRGDFQIPPDIMDSPKFKLFLYSCKLCSFKCNAIKELTAHRTSHQGGGGGRYRSLAKPPAPLLTPNPALADAPPLLTCTLCTFRATSRIQLNKHVTRNHANEQNGSDEDESNALPAKAHHGQTYGRVDHVTFYCCDTCDLQTPNKHVFKRHECPNITHAK